MTDALVLDTHALVWWQAESDNLPGVIRERIESSAVLVCPITFWEIAILESKGRLQLDRPAVKWAHDLLAQQNIGLADLTAAVAVRAGTMQGFHGDPADRIIAATASELGLPLVTKDARIHAYAADHPDVEILWSRSFGRL